MTRPSMRVHGGRVFAILTFAVPLLVRAAAGQDAEAYRLTLGDAARLAAERATPVLEARARASGADARVRLSTGDLLPSVGADLVRGGRTFNTASFGLDFPTPAGQEPFFDPEGEVVGPVHSADVRAHAEVPLLDLSALGRRRSASASAEAFHLGEGAAESAAASEAARAYLSTLRARAEVVAREEDLALARRLLEVAEGQLDAGAGVLIDVTRAQAQIATIRAQLLSAQHGADVAELALRRRLRLPDTASLELADDLESLEVGSLPDEDAAIARALDARADLRVAAAYRAAADEELSATRASRLPRLSAALDDGYYGKGFGGRLLNTYTWSLRLSVPVFDGLRRSARLQEQQAEVREMGYRVQDLEDEVVFEVRRALLNLVAAREMAAAAEERLRLSELEVSQEEDRAQAGVAGVGDLVRAAMRLNEARTGRLEALSALYGSRVALAAAMGEVRDLP